MKKYFLISLVCCLAFACQGPDKTAAATTESADLSSNPDYQKGLALIAKSDCLTCHNVDTKVTGPAYRDVAAKYTSADVSMLADKIVKGGQGVWGPIPMTPHPGVSQADAEQMVKYILLLKK